MTDTEKLVKIAERLLKRTEAGEIDWEETHDEHTFAASTERYSFNVYHYPPRCVLSVVNNRGREIERLEPEPETQAHTVLQELFELARKQALEVDESLDEILKTL